VAAPAGSQPSDHVATPWPTTPLDAARANGGPRGRERRPVGVVGQPLPDRGQPTLTGGAYRVSVRLPGATSAAISPGKSTAAIRASGCRTAAAQRRIWQHGTGGRGERSRLDAMRVRGEAFFESGVTRRKCVCDSGVINRDVALGLQFLEDGSEFFVNKLLLEQRVDCT
jgi:hypothetical protein